MATESPRRVLFYLSVLGVIAYGALLIENMSSGVGGSDSSGYANTARLILSGRASAPVEGPGRLGLPERFDYAFIPLAFEPGPRPRTMSSIYPPGFPLHIAAAALVAGWNAGPFIVSPIAGILGVMAMFLLARELGLSRPFALAGAAILGGCAVYLFQTLQPMSDVAATAWSLGAILFAMRSRRGDGWAVAAGAAFGIAVLVRPSSTLLAIPLIFALRWRPKTIALFLLGGAPFAAFLLVWNHAAYGHYFRTGYSGLLGGQMALAHFAPRFRHYGHWLIVQLSPLIPLGGLAAAFDRRVPGRDRAMILTWFLAFFLSYCLWGPYETWWYTRFLLPALPALILGSLLVARDLIRPLVERQESGPKARRLAVRAAAAVLLAAIVGLAEWRAARRLKPLSVGEQQAVFPEACRALSAKVPGRALVASMEFSGAIRFYTELTPLMWNAISREDFAVVRARAAEANYQILALLTPLELEAERPQLPGRWTLIGRVRGASLWELEPDP